MINMFHQSVLNQGLNVITDRDYRMQLLKRIAEAWSEVFGSPRAWEGQDLWGKYGKKDDWLVVTGT